MKLNNYYKNKKKDYFKNIRYDILRLIPKGNNKMLDVGCGEGYTLLTAKQQGKASYTVGIDIMDLRQKHNMDEFYCLNIEKDKLPLEKNYFDVIICGDVLEHLFDPWKVVRKLRRYLKRDGILIASIPNIRYYKVLFDILIKGDFKYTDAGILDKTHLKFFCKKNIIDLFEKNGFRIEAILHIPKILSYKKNLINLFTFNIFNDFWVVQYLVVTKKI